MMKKVKNTLIKRPLLSFQIMGIPLAKWLKAGATVGPFLIAGAVFYSDVQSMKESLSGLKERIENIETNTNTILQNLIGGNPGR